MQKKILLSSFSILFIAGLTFLVAKLKPCSAEMLLCSQNTEKQPVLAQTASFVDKKVPISDYSPESVKQALAENKRVILFFQASWCSTCYQIEQDLQNNASKIPNDVVISRVNIDKNKDIKAKYNVVAQDEMVELDRNGMEKSHWKSSQNAVQELLLNLK